MWQYWEGPCPEWIRACQRTVGRHGGDVRLLGAADFDRLWDVDRDIDLSGLYVAQRADFIRAFLLARYGGLWVDSDCVAMKPLSPLLDLLGTHEFLGYVIPEGEWISYAFIGSRPGGRVALAHYARVCSLLRSGQPLSWISLGALSLLTVVRQTGAPWYRVAVDLIEPVSDLQAFFVKDSPQGHERAFNPRSICYMLSNHALGPYSAHPDADLLADGTFFRYLLYRSDGQR